MASERIQRVNRLIQQELSQIILREFDFSLEVLITLTRVETSNNLIQAKVYVSVMPEDDIEKVIQALDRRIYELQQKLNQRLNMRPIPRIKFLQEKETVEAGRIEEILEKLKMKK